jgi:hypothetical protein
VQRDGGVGLAVHVNLSAEIMAGEHVAVQDDDWVIGAAPQAGRGVPDSAAGAEWLILAGVDDVQAVVRAVTEDLGEHFGPERGRQHDPPYARRGCPGQLMGEERDASSGQQRLGYADRQRPEPCPLTADQQDRLKQAAAGTTRPVNRYLAFDVTRHVQRDYPCPADAARS